MKFNKWTTGLAAVGVVSLASAARADETKLSQVQTALSNTTLSGYVDTSAMWNTGTQHGANFGQEGGQLPPYTPGGVHGDGFNLNAVDIALDKPLDESQWAAGYHVELMFGQDSVGENQASGNSHGSGDLTGYNSTENFAIRQAYLALRTPVGNTSIDWKFGVWDSPIGYESSSDPLNPNFTRSYGWFIEPTTMTGILGTFKATDWLTFQGGVGNAVTGAVTGNASNGNVPGSNGSPYETQKAYVGTITLTAPDSWGWMKGATLNGGVILSDNGSASGSGNGRTWLYVGATMPTPIKALKVGAAFDYLDYHDGGFAANPANDSIWVVGGYATYQFNDKLSLNVRGENYCATGAGASAGVPAEGHNVQEFTATLQYNLWANVLSRVEFRWDHAPGTPWDNGTTVPTPVSTGIHKNEYLLALNLIYQF
jgi:Putative beta-barrel porin-2, OmpL-like. bbp2